MVYIFIILKVLFQSFPDLVGMEFAKVFLAYFLLLFYVHFVFCFFWFFFLSTFFGQVVFLLHFDFLYSGSCDCSLFDFCQAKNFITWSFYLWFYVLQVLSNCFFSPFSHPMGGFRGIFTDFSLNFSLKSLNLPRNHDKVFYTLLERTTRYLYIVIYKQLHPNQSILVCIYS